MVLSLMLSKFGISSAVLERSKQLQTHPKAHYLSFRTCEVLSDLGLKEELESQLDQCEKWNSFVYTERVLSAPIASVVHFERD
mgnify:CR=1 FL=1